MIHLRCIIACVMASLAAGCAADGTEHEPAVTSEPHLGWDEAYRLSNGVVEAVVVPEIGRVMWFGFVGGENVLWTDPSLHGAAPKRHAAAWQNFGGDKVWPWPQAPWGDGVGWPPPLAVDPGRYEATVDGDAVVLTAQAAPYARRVVRRIALAAGEPRLVIRTTYEAAGEGAQVWQVTQLRSPRAVRAAGLGEQPVVKPLTANAPSVKLAGGTAVFEQQGGKAGKTGIDADNLTAERPGGVPAMLTIERTAVSAGDIGPGEAAQVYFDTQVNSAARSPESEHYVELEFLSPPTPDDRWLETTWTLERLD